MIEIPRTRRYWAADRVRRGRTRWPRKQEREPGASELTLGLRRELEPSGGEDRRAGRHGGGGGGAARKRKEPARVEAQLGEEAGKRPGAVVTKPAAERRPQGVE